MAAALALAGCGGGSSSDGEEMTGPTPAEMEEQRARTQTAALSTASTALNTALSGLSDTEPKQGQIDAVNSAIGDLEAALSAAADVDDDVKGGYQDVLDSAQNRVDQAKGTLMSMQDAEDQAEKKAMLAVGKALKAALVGTTGDEAENPLSNIVLPTLSPTGLTVNAVAGAGTSLDATDPDGDDGVELEAGDSAGSLSGWMGMDYADSEGTGDDKVTNEARVYTKRGQGAREAFADALPDGVTIATANAGGTNPAQVSEATTAIAGYIVVATAGTVTTELSIDNVMADAFTHSGKQTHTIASRQNSVSVRGTYDGASGEYRCVTACSSTNDNKGSPSALGGTWFFKPDSGAMVSRSDAHYLYYGWWVRKDSDGPTAASAFAGRAGTPGDDSETDDDGVNAGWSGAYVTTEGSETITGSASYAGSAAGKFAMNNVLDGTGKGGHFTADAMLSAKFSGTDSGVTGTIDNFRLNDASADPGWSVSLHLAGFGEGGAISAPVDDAATAGVDESMGTTWSINGNKASASGTWSGMMYDEAVTGDADDGSNIPTTVTGTFYSDFSAIGRMVGAFGAEKD